jgi:hypothetical protein
MNFLFFCDIGCSPVLPLEKSDSIIISLVVVSIKKWHIFESSELVLSETRDDSVYHVYSVLAVVV